MTSWVACEKGPPSRDVCFNLYRRKGSEGGGGGVARKSERDNRDVVEQLLDQPLLSSAAVTSASPDYTTLFP